MKLPFVDLVVLVVYVLGVVAFGCWFVRKSRSTHEFMVAGRSLPGWAVGLSIFGTYLSSNTFLGVPGKAYGTNWNSFVFSLSLPVAVLIAVKYFVPFYRKSGEISAYHHLEKRFGAWARTYAVVCYLLMQLARMGAIMFGVALAMKALTGWPMAAIIVASGVLVTLYTLVGGIEAVIWTDVAQSIVLLIGALVVAGLLLFGMPAGPGQVFSIAVENGKFSLGSFGPGLTQPTFWVVLVYGITMNLKNFGIDQSYIQRYHVARSDREAIRSVWIGGLMYVPISMLFFFIGTALFAFYQAHPDMLMEVKHQVAAGRLADVQPTLEAAAYRARLTDLAAGLTAADVGDRILPHFIVNGLPTGVAGLLIAAIFAAAMSSIDTSLNSSATVLLTDIYKRYIRPEAGERESMRFLHGATLAWGALAIAVALAMIGVKSVLDAWWRMSGTFAGGMLGLFLLGIIGKRVRRPAALTSAIVGLLLIFWMAFSPEWSGSLARLRCPLHPFLTSVVGTLTIVLLGLLLGLLTTRRIPAEDEGTP